MIQIFGTNKNFDCKTAVRFFKERRIPFQFIDLREKEMSFGEFESVLSAIAKTLGSIEEAVKIMTDINSKNYSLIAYLDDRDKADKLFEDQTLLKLPICRNGKTEATIGLQQKVWETWK